MPRGDGTGPAGMGPMTGRSAGFCAGFDVPGYANPVCCGFGFGRGTRRMFHATGLPGWARFGARHTKRAPFASDADERELLKRQV